MSSLITQDEENLMGDVIGANYPKPADPEIELLAKFYNRLKEIDGLIKQHPNDSELGEKIRAMVC